jgi:menaquinone-dependent protoporphyrinogen oxidase
VQQGAGASSAGNGQNTRLIADASRTGTTEIAQAIGRDLRGPGMRVDVLPAIKADRMEGYDALIIGSAVRFGIWLRHLARRRAGRSCAAIAPNRSGARSPASRCTCSRAARARRTAPSAPPTPMLRALLTPSVEAFFLTALLPERRSFLDKMAVRVVGAPLKYLRDGRVIAAWACTLPALPSSLAAMDPPPVRRDGPD